MVRRKARRTLHFLTYITPRPQRCGCSSVVGCVRFLNAPQPASIPNAEADGASESATHPTFSSPHHAAFSAVWQLLRKGAARSTRGLSFTILCAITTTP